MTGNKGDLASVSKTNPETPRSVVVQLIQSINVYNDKLVALGMVLHQPTGILQEVPRQIHQTDIAPKILPQDPCINSSLLEVDGLFLNS